VQVKVAWHELGTQDARDDFLDPRHSRSKDATATMVQLNCIRL
jgi:hypothetical protein